MARKTIKVEKVLDVVNEYLAASNSTPDGREGACGLLETLLFETGNYGGFRYLEQEHDQDGSLKTIGCGSRRRYLMK